MLTASGTTVFTASLVILGRILWAQNGQNGIDEAALSACKALLEQVQVILQNIDNDDSLIVSCSRYLRIMLEVCTSQGKQFELEIIIPSPRTNHDPSSFHRITSSSWSDLRNIDATTAVQQNGSFEDSSFVGTRYDHRPTAASGPNPLETMMHLGVEDLDMFHLCTSEMYDPVIFEGLDRL